MSIKKIKSDLSIEQKLLLPTKTAQRALVIDTSGEVVHSSVTETELGYLSGVTSSVLHANSSVTALSDVTDAGSGAIITAAERSKLDGIEAGADVTDATNVEAAGAVMESDTTTASMSFVIDEDSMASDLDTKVPTQQSVKAYVDAQVSAAIAGGASYAGGYDASAAPSGTASIGDMFTVTVAGNGAGFFATQTLEVGDMIIAEVTNPASEADWTVVQKNLEAATETSAGYIEIATTAEVDGGTDNTRAITPAGLAASALQIKVNGIEAGADVTDATNVEAAGAVMETDTSTAAMQFVVDQDDMADNSNTKVPTQQSVKAYVDSQAHAAVTLNAGATTQEAASLAGQEITLNQATTIADGVMSSEDKSKLDGIEAGANAGANTTLSNLTSPTAINQDLLPDAVFLRSLGSWTKLFVNGYFSNAVTTGGNSSEHTKLSHGFTTPSGATANGVQSIAFNRGVVLFTENKTATVASNKALVETGNTVDGNSGDIELRTGVPSGAGVRGNIVLKANADGARLEIQPSGTEDLAIATTKYVNDKIADAPSGSAGDIDETSQVLADAQAIAAPVPSLAFAVGTVRSFKCQVSIERGATFEVYELTGIQKSASWEMAQESVGDDCGITFTITAAGQIEYTSTATGAAPTVKFRATTTTV